MYSGMSLRAFEIRAIIEANKAKPYRIITHACYDDDCFADGAIQRIYTETCYFKMSLIFLLLVIQESIKLTGFCIA